MKLKSTLLAVTVFTSAIFAQEPSQNSPRDDAYVSPHRPATTLTAENVPIKDDALGRIDWMREVMGGDLTPEFMEAVMAAADKQREQYGPSGRGAIQVAGGGAWTNIGPDRSNWIQNGLQVQESDTGRVRTFLVHPTNPDVVYVLTSSGGLWKTTDFSAPRPTWTVMTDSILSTSGGSAALGKNPDTIYLGTGDPFDPGVGGYTRRSTDGGQTWSNGIKLGASTVVPDVKVDSSGATDVVLVATNAGLFRSTDGGLTYGPTPVLNGLVWSLARTSAGWLVARTTVVNNATVGSILYSTNQGATWVAIPNAGGVYAGAGRTTLGVGKPGDAVVYAFARDAGGGAGVQKDLFRSTDGGLNWTAIGLGQYVTVNNETVWQGKFPVNPNPDQPNMDVMAGQAFYNQMLLVDPNDSTRKTVYIGGQLSSAKSTDAGATWRIISNWLEQFRLPYVHADFHAAAFTTLRGDPTILFGTDGGLFLSSDGGRSFSSQKNDGISSYLIYAMTGNPKHPDDVLIGLQDDGSRWREGPTGTYNQVLGGDGFGVGWSQSDDSVSLASVYYSFIVRDVRNPPSTQRKWLVGWNGIEEFFNPALTYFNTSIATPRASADPVGLTFLHRTRFRLYRTTNGAASWTCIMETPLAATPAAGASPKCEPQPAPPAPPLARVALRAGSHPIGISPVDLKNFGVLGNGGWLYTTTDAGETWTTRSLTTLAAGWPGFNATLAYANNTTMYVGNEAPIGTTMRVIKSVDGGASWSNASTGLPPVPTTKLIVSPRDATGNTVYAGTWIGVYETTDGGATWHLYGTGLPIVVVSDLYMPSDGSYLRVSTYGRGVWETRF